MQIDNGSAATTATESVYGAPAQRPDDNPESDGGRLNGTAINSSLPMKRSGEHQCNRRDPSTKELCNKSFSRLADLTRHETTHDARKTHICDLCSKAFARRDALLRHKRTHDSTRKTPQSAVTKQQLAHRKSDKKRRDSIRKPLPDQVRKSCDRCHKRKVRCVGGQAGGIAEGSELSPAEPVVALRSCKRCAKAKAICKYSGK